MEKETINTIGELMLGIPLGMTLVCIVIGILYLIVIAVMDAWRQDKRIVIILVTIFTWFILSCVLITWGR